MERDLDRLWLRADAPSAMDCWFEAAIRTVVGDVRSAVPFALRGVELMPSEARNHYLVDAPFGKLGRLDDWAPVRRALGER